jgi:nitrate reductase beta subunit
VVNCIGKIRLFSYKSVYSAPRADNPIDYLVHIKKIALPLYPQFGLEPNVYYIPPIHVPEEFNRQLFGPGAKAAVEMYKNAREDKTFTGLMMLFGSTEKIVDRFSVSGDIESGHCTGYDAAGKEVVKVPITEPFRVREGYDAVHDVHRISVT